MIIALAGRRIDPRGAAVPRFPLENSQAVREKIRRLFLEKQATALVSAAACGADLLALDAAGELGIQRHIVLPFAPPRFRAASVIDRSGEWGSLFDRIVSEVQAAGNLVVLNEEKEDDEVYVLTNRAILDEAQSLMHRQFQTKNESLANDILALIVWDGQSRGEGDLTLDFASEARARAIPVTEILTI